MLIGLDKTEIRGLTYLKPVISIQLEKRRGNQIRANLSRRQKGLDGSRKRLVNSQTAVIEEFVGLIHEITPSHKDEFLDGMIEIRLNIHLCLSRCHTYKGCVLNLFYQVFMGLTDKSATLFRIQIDIVAPQHHTCNVGRIDRQRTVRNENELLGIEETLKRGNRDIDTNRVILKGEQGEIEARILTKVELERNIES